MLKIKENVNLNELKKFGFIENSMGNYDYRRFIDGILGYRVFVTKNHHYLKIQINEASLIAGTLQDLLYDLTKEDLVEKVEK